MSTTGSTNNNAANQGGSLQKVDRQAALASLRQPVGDVIDMNELAPVMATFREHMAQEQERNRRRLRAIVTAFVVALCVLLIAPIYVARMYMKAGEEQMKAQRAQQEMMAKSLEDSMATLSAQSVQLQAELEKQRALLAAAATSAPPAAPTVIVVTATVPASVVAPLPVPVTQQMLPPPLYAPISIPPAPQSIGIAMIPRELNSPSVVQRLPFALPPPDKMANLKITELKSMLDEVERTIQAKRHELALLNGG